MTQRERVSFRVAEGEGGKPIRIVLDPAGLKIDVFGYGFFGFDLGPDVAYGEAVALANLLNERVDAMTFESDLSPYAPDSDDDEDEFPPVAH